MIIDRPHLVEALRPAQGWFLVHGRRKTGKTFLVRQFVAHDAYYFVKRDRAVLEQVGGQQPRELTYETVIELLRRDLRAGRTVVVDEFHRLPADFRDTLHAIGHGGKLILVSSTLSMARRLVTERSPLLGLVQEVPVPLVDLEDALRAARHIDGNKGWLEAALLLAEPITAELVGSETNARTAWRNALRVHLRTIPALIGEAFTEESRRITGVYEGIMRAVATGHVATGAITSRLFANRLIDKEDPSVIQSHLSALVEIGILEKVFVFNRNRRVYRHTSPLATMFYHADERYNVSERYVTDQELDRIVDDMLPRLVENAVRATLARRFGLREAVAEAADHDVDVVLLRFKKPEVVAEVKWKRQVDARDIARAEETLARYNVDRRVLFVPDKTTLPATDLELMDPMDLIIPDASCPDLAR